jgi:hypothetical protein
VRVRVLSPLRGQHSTVVRRDRILSFPSRPVKKAEQQPSFVAWAPLAACRAGRPAPLRSPPSRERHATLLLTFAGRIVLVPQVHGLGKYVAVL